MAQIQYTEITKAMARICPRSWLRETAHACGYLQRKRRFSLVEFLCAILASFPTGRERTLSGIRLQYNGRARKPLSRSAFYERFNQRLTALMKAVVGRALDVMAEEVEGLKQSVSVFKDVLIADATVVRLHQALSKSYPACRTNHTKAAAKIHVVMSVKGAGAHTVRISKERVNDGKKLILGKWVQDGLLIFDLGYYNGRLFSNIDRYGGYFLCRLKKNANPRIVRVLAVHRGRAIDIAGQSLQDVLPRLRRRVLDCEVEVRFRRRGYLSTGRTDTARFRVIGVWNEEHRGYDLYVTNVPPELLSPEELAKAYTARWAIETLFYELKQYYRLDQQPSRKPEIVETLLYAAVLTLILSKGLLWLIRKAVPKDRRGRLKPLRWAAVFSAYAAPIIDLVFRRLRYSKFRRLLRLLKREAVDPNVDRPGVLERAGLALT